MTENFFEHPSVKLHYYKFGSGPQYMLCFHGFGMHGKQFALLEAKLGHKYTFVGFDLFFHKETKLKNTDLATVKKGLSKIQLAELIADFCTFEGIDRFSVLAYSMGTHYATAIVEELGQRVDTYIVAAPAALKPGAIVLWLSESRLGNRLLEKLMHSHKAMIRLIGMVRAVGLVNRQGAQVLKNEVGTVELRAALYANFTYLRFLKTDEKRLIDSINRNKIRNIFIFGRYDKQYSPSIGTSFFKKYDGAEVVVLNAGHQMINAEFVQSLTRLLS